MSPKTNETTKSADATKSDATTSPRDDGFINVVVALTERKIDDECPEAWHETDELDHPDAQDPKIRLRLLSERLERHRRKERRRQRAAEKKANAAKQRAEAQRRRAA